MLHALEQPLGVRLLLLLLRALLLFQVLLLYVLDQLLCLRLLLLGFPHHQIAAAAAPQRAVATPKPKAKAKATPRSPLPLPGPSFNGCWHCEGEDHARRTCETFKSILKANGGEVPAGYEGAYEKFGNIAKW